MRISFIILLIVTLAASSALASGTISIELDGLSLPMPPDVEPRIVGGRTLVPLRALAEALGGVVDYVDSSRTAIVYHGSSVIRFPLDKKVMYIDEEPHALDVAAQAFGGRAFLPARYLAEAMGALVEWDEIMQRVIVRTPALKRELVACYALESAAQFQSFGHHVNRAMVQWARLELKDGLVVIRPDLPRGYELLATEWARGREVNLSLQLFSEDSQLLTSLLEGDRAGRVRLAEELVDLTLTLGFSGISLDLEAISASSKGGFIELVALLSELGQEHSLHLSVYVPPKRSLTDYAAYDYAQLAPLVDQLVIMAHDRVRPANPPGPPSPLWWVEQIVRFALSEGGVPREKLVLGVSLHGLNWPKDGLGRAIEQPMSVFTSEWLAARGLEWIPYQEAQGMGYMEYSSPEAGERILWVETVESIAAKVALINRYNIAGISFWRLGAASPELFLPGGPFAGFKTP